MSVITLPLRAQPIPSPIGETRREPRLQTFIAPSGKPFHAPPGAPYPLAGWFASADANHDGKIDLSEFRADFQAFFNELDVDHDGRISADEITRYEREVAPEVQVGSAGVSGGMATSDRAGGRGTDHRHGGGGTGRGGGMGRGGSSREMGHETGDRASRDGSSAHMARQTENVPRGAGLFGLINSPEPVAAMDTDMSGAVTRAEAQGAADRRFHMLDPDNKGYLTLATLPEVPVQQRGKMRNRRRRDQ